MNNKEDQDSYKKSPEPVTRHNRKNWVQNKNNLIVLGCLFFILFLAFAIRYKGITFGLPISPHLDETFIVKRAEGILKSKDLNPHFFNYPSLYIYMQAGLQEVKRMVDETPTYFSKLTEIEKSTIYVNGRLLTLFFSIGTIFTVFLIGMFLFDRNIGLLSMLLISFSFIHVHNSNRITVDSPMVFWVTLSFLMSVLIFAKGPKLKYYIFNGVFIGLAIGTKYTAFVAAVPLIYTHLNAGSFSIKKIFQKNIIIAFLLIILAFVVSTPYSVLDFNKFKADIIAEGKHYSTGHPGYESKSSTSYGAYFSSLLKGSGIIPIIFSLLGILYLILTDRLKAFLLLLFPVLLFLFIGRYKVFFQRNLLALIPFLSVFSGFLLAAIAKFFSRETKYLRTLFREKGFFQVLSERRTYLALILLLLGSWGIYGIAQQGAKSYRHVKVISLPNTRWIATKWIEKNIPQNSKIAMEHYTPRPNRRLFKISLLGIGGLSKRKNLEAFDFLVTSSGDYNRFFRNKKKYKKRVNTYTQLFKKFELVKEFKPDNLEVTGPIIKILKVKQGGKKEKTRTGKK